MVGQCADTIHVVRDPFLPAGIIDVLLAPEAGESRAPRGSLRAPRQLAQPPSANRRPAGMNGDRSSRHPVSSGKAPARRSNIAAASRHALSASSSLPWVLTRRRLECLPFDFAIWESNHASRCSVARALLGHGPLGLDLSSAGEREFQRLRKVADREYTPPRLAWLDATSRCPCALPGSIAARRSWRRGGQVGLTPRQAFLAPPARHRAVHTAQTSRAARRYCRDWRRPGARQWRRRHDRHFPLPELALRRPAPFRPSIDTDNTRCRSVLLRSRRRGVRRSRGSAVCLQTRRQVALRHQHVANIDVRRDQIALPSALVGSARPAARQSRACREGFEASSRLPSQAACADPRVQHLQMTAATSYCFGPRPPGVRRLRGVIVCFKRLFHASLRDEHIAEPAVRDRPVVLHSCVDRILLRQALHDLDALRAVARADVRSPCRASILATDSATETSRCHFTFAAIDGDQRSRTARASR